MKNPSVHWVLWDGDCGFCAASVARVRRMDHRPGLHFIPYQEAPSPPMTPRLREACRHAVHIVTADGRIYAGGRAFLWMFGHGRWSPLVSVLSLPPFVWIVELGYRLIAANRGLLSRLLLRRQGCAMPPSTI